MAKIEEPEIVDTEVNCELTPEPCELATTGTDTKLPAFEGEITAQDVRLEKLKLFHPLSGEAGQGIGKMGQALFSNVVVADENTPVSTIILSFVKTYVERLPYGVEERPRIYKTQKDYVADGLTFKDVDETAKMSVLIRKPEKPLDQTSEDDMDFLFNIDLAGEKWALGYMYVRGVAFKEAITPITSFIAHKGFENGFRPYRVNWTPVICSRKASPNTKYAKWKTSITRGSEGQLDEVLALPFADALA